MNSGHAYRERVRPEESGRTLLRHLASRYRHSAEEVWRARLGLGEVLLDGVRATGDEMLLPGLEIIWYRPPWEEPAVPLAFAVLHEDADLLAVAKVRGLPTVPNGGFLDHTLLRLVQRHWPEATPLHRLGRGTSGVVVFARSDRARRIVSAAWRGGHVEKVYRALVTGSPSRERFSVEVPIGRLPHPRLGHVHAAHPAGRPAASHVRVVGSSGGDAIVEVTIPTGRPHQIRIHLAAAGHPLVGDPLYVAGGVPGEAPGLPGEGGYWLHAYRVAFDHPADGKRIELICGPPPRLVSGSG